MWTRVLGCSIGSRVTRVTCVAQLKWAIGALHQWMLHKLTPALVVIASAYCLGVRVFPVHPSMVFIQVHLSLSIICLLFPALLTLGVFQGLTLSCALSHTVSASSSSLRFEYLRRDPHWMMVVQIYAQIYVHWQHSWYRRCERFFRNITFQLQRCSFAVPLWGSMIGHAHRRLERISVIRVGV